ncbi:hypothetical protein AAVH_29710 [Aphelenchoides avenae]|nr:hypothetical protein AAVH_29710 [Aphelenchus avenae]
MPITCKLLPTKYPIAPDVTSSMTLHQMKVFTELVERYPEVTRLGPEPKCPKSGDTSQFIGAGKVRLGLLEKEARSIIHTRRLECERLTAEALDFALVPPSSPGTVVVDLAEVNSWSRQKCNMTVLAFMQLNEKRAELTEAIFGFALALQAVVDAAFNEKHHRIFEAEEANKRAAQMQKEVDALRKIAADAEQRALQAEKDLEAITTRIDAMATAIRKEYKTKKKDRKTTDPVDRLEASIALLKERLTKEADHSPKTAEATESGDEKLKTELDQVKLQLEVLQQKYYEEKLLVGQQTEELTKLRAAAKLAKKIEKKSKKN